MTHDLNKLQEEIDRRELCNSMAPFPIYDTEIINDLKIREEMISRKQNFNNVPVTYCTTCLSLKVKDVVVDHKKVNCCMDCGNTPTAETHIEEWQDLYKERYGEEFLVLPKQEE